MTSEVAAMVRRVVWLSQAYRQDRRYWEGFGREWLQHRELPTELVTMCFEAFESQGMLRSLVVYAQAWKHSPDNRYARVLCEQMVMHFWERFKPLHEAIELSAILNKEI